MSRDHTDGDTLLAFIDDPKTLSAADQVQLAQHLTSGCETCWSAVDLLPPVQPFRPSPVALREALLHLICAESHAVLAGDHLSALAHVRRAPTGFARLLLAEALSIGLAHTDDGAVRDPVVRDLMRQMAEDAGPGMRELADLSSQYLVDEALILLQEGRLKAAAQSLVEAGAVALHGTSGADLAVNLCEAHARLAWNHGDLPVAVATYGRAVAFLEASRAPARRFEVHSAIATLHTLCGSRTECARAEEAARQALEPLRKSPDPTLATGAVLREAELTLMLTRASRGNGELRTRGIRQAADDLLAKAGDFERFTDPLTRACKDLCLARLVLFFDRKEAMAHYQRAAATLRSCQADEQLGVVVSESLMVILLGNMLAESGEHGPWTGETLRDLLDAVLQRSTWIGLDVDAVSN